MAGKVMTELNVRLNTGKTQRFTKFNEFELDTPIRSDEDAP